MTSFELKLVCIFFRQNQGFTWKIQKLKVFHILKVNPKNSNSIPFEFAARKFIF